MNDNKQTIPSDKKLRDTFSLNNTPAGEDAKDDTDITDEEIALLDAAGNDDEEKNLEGADLDDADEDGDPLNEASSASDQSGRDLDVPGSENDDENEDIGEEDEENNSYSLGGDEKDQ